MEPSFDLDTEPQKVIDVSQPKSSRPLWQKILFLVIVLAVASLLIFGITSLINNNDSSGTEKETEEAEETVATGSAEAKTERCLPKQDLNNDRQGYFACFESAWQQKEIKPSGLEIGLSATEITGSFPGTINIAITDKSEELVTQELSNNSSKFEFGKVNVDGKKSTQLIITRSRDDTLIAYPRAIVTATTANGRTYVFTLNSTDATFEADTSIYEDFLGTVEFLTEVDNPPWSESRNIVVNQPWPEDSITSPVTVSGEALSFEAVVNVRVKDSGGKTLTETTIKTASGTDRSAFSGTVTFDKGKSSEGTIEVYTTSSADGSEQDKVTLKVKFQ